MTQRQTDQIDAVDAEQFTCSHEYFAAVAVKATEAVPPEPPATFFPYYPTVDFKGGPWTLRVPAVESITTPETVIFPAMKGEYATETAVFVFGRAILIAREGYTGQGIVHSVVIRPTVEGGA